MKMRASGGRRDEADIKLLLGQRQITSVNDALALYEESFPDDDLPPQAIPMPRHAFLDRGLLGIRTDWETLNQRS
jgi:hypothetical protein